MAEDGQSKQETTHLLNDGWPCGNSHKKEETLRVKSRLNMNISESKSCSFVRPTILGEMGDEGEEDEDGPRMGDLIREAMPCRLARAPSLPTSKIRKEVVAAEAGMARGGPAIGKLTRRSSMDPSLILLAKNIAKTKGTKQGSSASSTPIRKMETKRVTKPTYLERSMSLKSLSDKEVQGFQELGFTFDKEDLSSSVAAKFDSLQIKKEPSMEGSDSPPKTKRVDSKSSAEDMKAQIKFWARSVASNVN